MTRVLILSLSLLLLSARSGYAETNNIILACDGKVTEGMITDATPEATNNVGVVVDVSNATVSFNGYVVHIDKVDAATVSFSGDTASIYRGLKTPITVSGTIDRVTGAMQANTMLLGAIDKKIISSQNWDLLCKPKSRMF